LQDETETSPERQQTRLMKLIEELKSSPVAIETAAANEQHYEIPTAFFQRVLGPNMKYSSCFWEDDCNSLSRAEEDALKITCVRAAIEDGMKVLELGCGWGSLTLYAAAKFPNLHITGVSNSTSQKEYIEKCCRERGLSNVNIITADMNSFEPAEVFDRVISVEMFEHMRNYRLLLQRISNWLKPDGRLFVHIFTHRQFAYCFDVVDESDWMSRYFFTGGMMPSDHLLFYFNEHLRVEQHWHWSGQHYQKTSEAWLRNMDEHKKELLPIIASVYGEDQKVKWWVYWRVFFMACAELWGFKEGKEWMVSHYLMQKTNKTDSMI
jgi:cyclopropane-fatty-acyl-phospholipid synthase